MDYDRISFSLLIEAGHESAEIPIRGRPDADMEGIETVDLTLQPGEDYELAAQTTARVSIGESRPFDSQPARRVLAVRLRKVAKPSKASAATSAYS